jgi:hypothetical protein
MIVILPDLPFALSPVLNSAMGKLSFWIYRMIFLATGETVVIGPEVIFVGLVVSVSGAFIYSLVRDVREIRRPLPSLKY